MYVEHFMQSNKDSIDRLYRKMNNTMLSAAQKIISIEMEAACKTFIEKKHNKDNIKQYLFATIHNTIRRINNEDKKYEYNLNIDDWSNNRSLITNDIQLSSIKEDIETYSKILINTIDTQMRMIEYNSINATLKLKTCMYNAFKKTIRKYPVEMISSLVFLNRETGMQAKIFQEFIFLLEKELPFSFIQDNKIYKIKSLLDDDMSIFAGVSEFIATVDEKREIENLTKELYVGGRKGIYCRPYYIGKLLGITDENGKSIIRNVKEYGFSRIVMSNRVRPKTRVLVRHLGILPHHQMGALSYLNKIRREIVDRVYYSLNGKKRAVAR